MALLQDGPEKPWEREEREREEAAHKKEMVGMYGRKLGTALLKCENLSKDSKEYQNAMIALAELFATISETGTHQEKARAYLALFGYINTELAPVKEEAHSAAMHHAVY